MKDSKDSIRTKFEEVALAINKTEVKDYERLYYLSETLDNLTSAYVRLINLSTYEEAKKMQEQMDLNVYDMPNQSSEVN